MWGMSGSVLEFVVPTELFSYFTAVGDLDSNAKCQRTKGSDLPAHIPVRLPLILPSSSPDPVTLLPIAW
jgi:hypothetical protein